MGKYCYELIRPEDPDELAEAQDFRGFYGVSQYWRLTVCSNYGNPQTCVRGVQFYGIGGSTLLEGVWTHWRGCGRMEGVWSNGGGVDSL